MAILKGGFQDSTLKNRMPESYVPPRHYTGWCKEMLFNLNSIQIGVKLCLQIGV